MSQGVWPEVLPKANVILADPPWRYEFGRGSRSRPQDQYDTMLLEEICALPVDRLAAQDCVLFLWTTTLKLLDATDVIRSWGFRYVSSAVWCKETIGMGYYFRQAHEFLLVARRGTPGLPAPSVRPSSVIRAKKGIHSRKPWCVYEMIERMYPDAVKLELFCRTPQPGWQSWGLEAEPNLFNGPILPLEALR